MKASSSAIVLGISLLMLSGSPARAQLGDMGEAVKKGASDAAKQEIMKQAGLPTPGTPAAAPAGDAGAANAPADTPKVAPGAAEAPANAPGAAATPQDAGGD
jgi:hypothetical protein